MFAIRAGILLTPRRVLRDAYVLVEGEKIIGVSADRPKDVREIHRYDDYILAPGLVDIHNHGGFGYDLTYSTIKEIREFSRRLLATGVTSYMPSTVTDSSDRIESAVKNISEASETRCGSRILGIHLEGPYLNPERSGAQSKKYIREPSLEEFERLYNASHGLIRRVTVAPEVKNGIDFIRSVIERFNVKVSLGHTDATYEQALNAIKAGANIITHLFNGMRGYHHREPGIIGAALTTDVYAEIIADLIHLHPVTITLTLKCKGPGRLILVSDATPGAGLPDGVYMLGPSKVVIKDGIARTEDGVLAGSTLMLINAIRNIIKIGFSLKDAFRMATSTPCEAMGFRNIGRVTEGCRADLLVLNKQLDVMEVYVDGERYEKPL
ncbi:MAG: N-acetylglucosamine-6-phosphate deacetylase [Candidatus Bathyarchaeia archaeon]|nr:N-acetylglucosamine-6-phosphate deacetylase [Candidatus Bathyarchaeota archaeon]